VIVQRVSDWVRVHRLQVDLALAVGLWLLITVSAGNLGDVGLVVSGLQILPLALRRVAPLPAAGLVVLGCLLQLAATDTPMASNVAVLIVVYSAAAHDPARWRSLTVLGAALVGAAVATADWTGRAGWSAGATLGEAVFTYVFLTMSVLVAWLLGDVVRRRKALIARLTAQNEALARDRAQRARLAAQGERASIAREMHDIVAHSLSVVVVQADGGAYTARAALERDRTAGDPAALERAAQTLETLAATARSALADTRRLVGVLRESGSAAEYAPQQGLGHLEPLVQRLRDSGVPVALAVRGDGPALPPEVDLAAYRVVQESLTNVLKHAGHGARAEVDVLRSPAVLLVRVSDDGRGLVEHDGAGNGILGMTERVQVLGGTLYAGARTGGGFEVVASVPVHGQESGTDD